MVSDRFVTDWEIDTRRPYYTRANAGEVLADPASPLGWTLVFEQGLLKGWRQGFVDFGVYQESEMDTERPAVTGMFGGYFYLNLSYLRLMGLRMGSTPDVIDAAYLGRRPGVPPYRPLPDDECADCTTKIAQGMHWAMTAESYPEIDADRRRALAARDDRPDLRTLIDTELVERMRSFLPELANAFYRHDYTAIAATVGPALIGEVLADIGRPELLLDLLSGWGAVDSAAPSFALWDLARSILGASRVGALLDQGAPGFVAALDEAADTDGEIAKFRAEFDNFVHRYGCRGPNEWDIHAASWEADPTAIAVLLDRLRTAPDDASPYLRLARLRERRLAAADTVRTALDKDTLATFEIAMRSASVFIPARERTKTNAATFINEVRMTALELGRRGVEVGRFAEPADVMMLLESELDGYLADPDSFTGLLAERLAEYRELFLLDPPFIIADRVPPLSEWPLRLESDTAAESGAVLTGAPAAHGRYQGRVRVVRDLSDPSALRPGEVMVAPSSDAAWTPLFLVAGAVVLDVGATNSHGAVICRELGLPCAVSVTGATGQLRDGMLVTVDGDTGTVIVDEVPEGIWR
jgi:pyruvate,water dikinase